MDKQKSKLERKQKRFIKQLSKEKERRPEEIASTIDFDDPDVKKVVNEIFEDKQALENQWEPFNSEVDMFYFGLLAFAGVATYGFILLVNYCMNYLDNYPEKKLEHGIYLDFKILSLRKISTIDYTEYQKIGTGKLVQRIENGSTAGRNVLFNFWLCLIRDLLPTIGFSIYFIWKIDEKVTYVLFVGYAFIFIITNILLKFLYKIKEKILNSEELLNHYLVRGYMEMLVFRMTKQFPSEIKKTLMNI